MALHLFASNHLHTLAQHMSENWRRNSLSYFAPDYMITQTEGMNIWLKQTIAQQQGIASNLKFEKPNDILFKVYRLLGGPFQKTLSRDSYVWLLYQILGTAEFKTRFPKQAHYLLDIAYDQDLKRLMLAEKIADLFDQYQIYRQEFIQEWSSVSSSEATHWQAYLWAKIEERSELTELHNINNISNYILDNIDNPIHTARLQAEMPKIVLFGLSIYTKYHLKIFFRLATYIDLDFYLLNPAPELYWGDDKNEKDIALWKAKGFQFSDQYLIGNDLLTNWGKLVQNTLRLLFQNDEAINAYEIVEGKLVSGGSLLHQIQSEIYNNALFEDRVALTPEILTDESIVISSNYTAQREVESLYNYIVHLIDKRGELLSGRDILVMCSDIDIYAPFIKAVFDNAPYRFKYHLSDVSVASEDNIYKALLDLLHINEDGFSAEAVLQLLDNSYIRNQYQLTDLPMLRKWVQMANIRWGISGKLDDETYMVSWLHGIKSIMFGMCMSGEIILEEGDELFSPLDEIEGAARLEVIRFCSFVLQLIQFIQQRRGARTISEWMAYVEVFIKQLVFDSEEEVDEDYIALTQTIANYKEASKVMTETLSYETFFRNFIQHINGDVRSKLFYNDGITFCSIVPMRSIPFKVVAMLGLGASDFPRKEMKLNFNLMLDQHQLGDRNIKDSDKHLFLESLLSAESYFYLSYIGRSVKDNTLKNASIVIEELLHYLQLKSDGIDVTQLLVTEHPLHSFSAKYNNTISQLYFYNEAAPHEMVTFWGASKIQTTPTILPKIVAYSTLMKMVKQPILVYFQQALGWYTANETTKIEEHEVFETDALLDYQLRTALLEQYFSEEVSDNFTKEWQLKGLLPLKNVGEAYVLNIKAEVENQIVASFPETIVGAKAKSIPFELVVDEYVVNGQLRNVVNGKVLGYSWSKNYYKALYDSYIDAVIGKSLGITTGFVFVIHSSETKKVITFDNDQIMEDALVYFRKLLQYYATGLKAIIEFDIRLLPRFISDNLQEHDEMYCNYEELRKTVKYDEIQTTYFTRFINETQLNNGMIKLNALAFFKDLYGAFIALITQK